MSGKTKADDGHGASVAGRGRVGKLESVALSPETNLISTRSIAAGEIKLGNLITRFTQETPKRRKSNLARQWNAIWIRPIFRGYHIAYAIMLFLIIAQIAFAYYFGNKAFGIKFQNVLGVATKLWAISGWFLLPLLWIGSATISIVKKRRDNPSRLLGRWIRFNSDWLIRGFLIIFAYPTMAQSFSIIKALIPELSSYWADPMFIAWDQAILGSDAWKVTHGLFPSWFLLAIDRVYVLWFTYIVLMTGVYSFTRDVRFQIRSALTFFLCWIILGIIIAFAFGSVGPVFYDRVYYSDHFANLVIILNSVHAENGLVAMHTVDFLLENVGKPKLGVGISAMPSMHVSMAFLGFLMATHFKKKMWLKAFTLIFTVATVIGSVHLGWHYLVDGVISIIVTYMIWMTSNLVVNKSYRGIVERYR